MFAFVKSDESIVWRGAAGADGQTDGQTPLFTLTFAVSAAKWRRCRDLLQAATGQVHGPRGLLGHSLHGPQGTTRWFFVTKLYLSSLIRHLGCVQIRSTWPRWCWISWGSSNSEVVLLCVLADFLVQNSIWFGRNLAEAQCFWILSGWRHGFRAAALTPRGLVSLRTSSVYFEGTGLFTAHVDDKSKDKHGAVAGTSVR